MALSRDWEAVLLVRVPVGFTPILNPDLTGKIEARVSVLPLLRQGSFSLLLCKKGSEIQRGDEMLVLEGILK